MSFGFNFEKGVSVKLSTGEEKIYHGNIWLALYGEEYISLTTNDDEPIALIAKKAIIIVEGIN